MKKTYLVYSGKKIGEENISGNKVILIEDASSSWKMKSAVNCIFYVHVRSVVIISTTNRHFTICFGNKTITSFLISCKIRICSLPSQLSPIMFDPGRTIKNLNHILCQSKPLD